MATQQDAAFKQANESIRKSLECCCCKKQCLPPIYMCPLAHNWCNSCHDSTLDSCPTCQEPGNPSVRNLFAEQVSVTVKLPCKNAKGGCAEVYGFKEMDQHLEKCNKVYGYACLLGDDDNCSGECEWKGTYINLAKHVREKHGEGCYSEKEWVTINCKEEGPIYSLTDTKVLLVAHQRLFWIHFYWDPEGKTRLLWAEYAGPKEYASKYKCEFRYCSNDGRLETSCCLQTLCKNDDFLLPTHSLLLSDNLIKTFTKNGVISVTARILEK